MQKRNPFREDGVHIKYHDASAEQGVFQSTWIYQANIIPWIFVGIQLRVLVCSVLRNSIFNLD